MLGEVLRIIEYGLFDAGAAEPLLHCLEGQLFGALHLLGIALGSLAVGKVHVSDPRCSNPIRAPISGLASAIARRCCLFEYRQTLDREKAVVRSREHVQLGKMLLEGRREDASLFMKLHLSSVSLLKTVGSATASP